MTSAATIALSLLGLMALWAGGATAATPTRHCAATSSPVQGKTVYASMNGGRKRYRDATVTTVPLDVALANACSHDVIQLVADHYDLRGRALTVRRHPADRVEAPIVIRGLGAGTIIRGGTPPGYGVSPRSMRPDASEHACLRLHTQSSIVIERMHFEGCWPIAIHAIDSRYITWRDSRIVGSTFGLYAQGRCEDTGGRCGTLDNGDAAHHYLVENVEWIQDPPADNVPAGRDSIAPGNMWRRYWWKDVHDRGRPYHYLNGALFGSWNILGSVVFRNNAVHNAFNGIRLNLPKRVASTTRNLNIEIYGNHFNYIRDNSIEPEREVTNLWVHGNRSFNAYAPLSTDGVGGNYWYVFGNLHWFDEAPARDCALDPGCRQCLEQPECRKAHRHRRGKTLKGGQGPFPGEAFYLFHNSIYQRHPNASGGETRNLHVWNNAIEVCAPTDNPDDGCRASQSFADFCYHPSYNFGNNVANDPGCMARCDEPDAPPVCVYEDQYDVTATPIFVNPRQGDLRLPPTSPARDAATPLQLTLPDGSTWSNAARGSASAPDVGAHQEDTLFRGPPFVLFEPQGQQYPERPRIVGVAADQDGDHQVRQITFSVPVEFAGPPAALVMQLKVNDPASEPVAVSTPCQLNGPVLRCRFATGGPPMADRHVLMLLPEGLTRKRRDGRVATTDLGLTLWSSVDPRACLQPNRCPNWRVPDRDGAGR